MTFPRFSLPSAIRTIRRAESSGNVARASLMAPPRSVYWPSTVFSIPSIRLASLSCGGVSTFGSLPKTITPVWSSLVLFRFLESSVTKLRIVPRYSWGMLSEASTTYIVVSFSFRWTLETSARAKMIAVTTDVRIRIAKARRTFPSPARLL